MQIICVTGQAADLELESGHAVVAQPFSATDVAAAYAYVSTDVRVA